MLSAGLVLAASMVVGQTDAEKAFKAYTDFAVGGVWTTTDGGERVTAAYRKVANGKFVELTQKGGPLPFVCMIGVDLETKKCTWWFFNEDGGRGTDVLSQEAKGVFLLEGTGKGPKGDVRYKGRITQVDVNTVTEEVIEFVLGGKKQPTQTFTWKHLR